MEGGSPAAARAAVARAAVVRAVEGRAVATRAAAVRAAATATMGTGGDCDDGDRETHLGALALTELLPYPSDARQRHEEGLHVAFTVSLSLFVELPLKPRSTGFEDRVGHAGNLLQISRKLQGRIGAA